MSYLKENIYTRITLRCHGGKFRILTFSDTHGVVDFNRQLVKDIASILDRVKPNLVLFLGDQVWRDAAESTESLRDFLSELVAPVEERKIPWAHVFGNHDGERGLPNEKQENVYESFRYCISKRGPADVPGTGNYVLPIMDEKGDRIIYNIFAFDSHNCVGGFLGELGLGEKKDAVLPDHFYSGQGYDTLRFEQLMWYWNSSKEMEEYQGYKIPALAVFHTPLPEFMLTYKNVAETHYSGTRREGVGCGEINSGVFSTFLERGDVKTIVCGHDHINDFEGTYLGIKMAMDAGISYDGYCDDDLRGGRVIEIDENNPWEISSWMERAGK